nr:MAG TPA: hypothetical protein [Caudoviricetes sp.]
MQYTEAIVSGNAVLEEPKVDLSMKSVFGKLKSGKTESIVKPMPVEDENTLIKPRRRGRPPKKNRDIDSPEGEASELVTNVPYAESYEETNGMLKGMIMQIEGLQGELKQEFNDIRLSTRMRGKYQYLTDISATISSLSSTKLAAIKELNSVISKCHDMELKRTKELKIDATGNDDAAVMSLYENIINTPRQQLEAGFMPPRLETGDIPLMVQPQGGMDIFQPAVTSEQFTPEQNRMIAESNPDIKTVVVYDTKTEYREFIAMNVKTGQVVQNISLPDPFLLEDMNLNFQTGVARNSNLNMNFPLAVRENGIISLVESKY